ncbi:hypothetical protein GCM10023091_17030 [Ravibacter arvi]|uniref:HEAT repeat domain-containing protein n=1 Tax=Ravibacter arvi TaxID=2051041 RepID=A0ABP8LWU0_9BACT
MRHIWVNELSELLLRGHSRVQRDIIVGWIGREDEKLAAAVHLLRHGDYREVQRISWVLSAIADHTPEALHPYLPQLVDRLKQRPVPDAVKRNGLRILALVPLPSDLHSDLVNLCFGYLVSGNEPIAIKSFSMSVLARLTGFYPDLKGELLAILELELEKDPSPGIKSKAKKIRARLQKQQ